VEFLEVDGSQGEGGGQILRAAVTFSVILGRPVRVTGIRAGREEPGLKRQHVSTLRVLAQVFGGAVSGATEGSSGVSFVPGSRKLDTLSLDMGTAASITLVLQAVIPAAALSKSRLALELVGGTDVPWSPTFDYLQYVVRPAYAALGVRFGTEAIRRGFYPRGGGRVRAEVEPSDGIVPTNLAASSNVKSAKVSSLCSLLPKHVSERQLRSAVSVLEAGGLRVDAAEAAERPADSPGSTLLVCSTDSRAFLGCDSLGSRGKPSESVGAEAATKFVDEARSGATLDTNLADMMVPLLSLAPGPSAVRVRSVSSHLRTGLALAKQFTSFDYSSVREGGSWVVNVSPKEGKGRNPRHNV
jgi:RNA 3'-terminal phosphate cyclase (ATP)